MGIAWAEGIYLPSKYKAVKTVVDNISFDSKKEAARYCELRTLFRAGKIQTLEIQKRFDIVVDGKKVGKRGRYYLADFVYFKDGQRIIEDVKGYRTSEYKLKKDLIEAIYKVKIVEV